MNDARPGRCCSCESAGSERQLTLTERIDGTSAVGIWRVCSWPCLEALARRKRRTVEAPSGG